MSENEKWYTVVLIGQGAKGPISSGACIKAESVKEAQDKVRLLCTLATYEATGETIRFSPSAVFDGELTNLVVPDTGDTYVKDFKDTLMKSMASKGVERGN